MKHIFADKKRKLSWRPAHEALDVHMDQSRRMSTFRVGLLVPMSGSAGLWGPSCIASAQLAVHELNCGNGVAGRPIELYLLDSAAETSDETEAAVRQLVDEGAIDAIVGMHISAVRDQLIWAIAGRIPYIYTPLHEGVVSSPGVFAIGDTPDKLLRPSLSKLTQDYKISKWALIGNDYVWPRASHHFAKSQIAELGADIAVEEYVPFASNRLEGIVKKIKESRADGVLVSLVGQDAVDFNRLFGAEKMHLKAVRLSCAIEENGLMASGAENLERLFCASSYFGCMDTEINAGFREQYHNLHGERAPMLNALGQSTFEGIRFLAELMKSHQDVKADRGPISYKSIRNAKYTSHSTNTSPVYLARANGMVFDDLRKIG